MYWNIKLWCYFNVSLDILYTVMLYSISCSMVSITRTHLLFVGFCGGNQIKKSKEAHTRVEFVQLLDAHQDEDLRDMLAPHLTSWKVMVRPEFLCNLNALCSRKVLAGFHNV